MSPRRRNERVRTPRLEPLEDRRLLANVTVGNLNDVVNGTTTSIAALIATPGADGISLREAVLAANADTTDPADTISFGAAVAGTIPLTNVGHVGEIVINSNLTINGPGANLLTIRGEFAGTAAAGDGARIFNVDAIFFTRTVAISGLTLTGGDAASTYGGGAILNFENLTITGCTISGNRAGGGGGITNRDGNLSVVASTISGNTSGGHGGGIYSNLGTLTVSRSTISGNAASYSSGGIRTNSTTTTIDASTISGNTAGNAGGGIYVGGGISTITNSTISGNSAKSVGGGVWAPVGNLDVRHSTITLNRSDSDNNGNDNETGGGVSGQATLSHTIVAGNLRGATTRDDISGAVVASSAFNLIGVNTGLTGITNGTNGNQIGTGAAPINPVLGPLADNGGPTLTHAFLAGSPALDAGDPTAAAGVGNVPLNDQRGVPFRRLADGDGAGGSQIDIGAYEQQSTQAANLLVVDMLGDDNDGNTSPGDFSLREAIGLANASTAPSTIKFAAALTSGGPATILLIHGELAIGESLTISGPGASLLTIDASASDPTPATNNGDGSKVFNINDGATSLQNVTLQGLTLTGADSANPDIFTEGPSGAIFSAENLTVEDCVIRDSSDIGIDSNAGSSAPNSLTVRNSTISGNVNGVFQRYGSLVIERTTIANNGLGIGAQSAQVDIRGTTVANNSRTGIAVSSESATIINSTISGNRIVVTSLFAIAVSGGGIQSSGNLILRYCTITDNLASAETSLPGLQSQAHGGGMFINGTAVLDHTIVFNNSVNADIEDGPDISGSVSARFSLIGNPSGATITNNGGNLIGLMFDPLLGPLTDSGGPTMTRALLAGSPAINAGDPAAVAGVGNVPLFDQRGVGFSRVVGGRIDIGAFEAGAVSANFDKDLDVDGFDFLAWQRGLGATGAAATHTNGNADGDGDVDGDDLAVWKSQFGSTSALSAATTFQSGALAATEHPFLVLRTDSRVRSGDFGSPVLLGPVPFEGREPKESMERAADAVFAAGDFTQLFVEQGTATRRKWRPPRRTG